MTVQQDNIRLRAGRWLLLSEADSVAHRSDGEEDFSGGYRHAVSAQSVYYRTGSITEHKALASLLSTLQQPFPCYRDVELLLQRRDPPLHHYVLDQRGRHWYLENQSPAIFDNPFESGFWYLHFESCMSQLETRLSPAQVKSNLSLIEHLGGEFSIDEVLDAASSKTSEQLVSLLLSAGLLENCSTPKLDSDNLPEFLFLGHSSFMIQDGDTRVVVDPVCLPGNEIAGSEQRPLIPILRSADVIVISHHHWDHLHFQTLCRLRKDTRFIVPKVTQPTFANPPIADYLRNLGFSNIEEVCPGDIIQLSKITLRLFSFYGESFGLGSHFDAFTYHFSFANRTLFGSVDACFDEAGDMEDTISEVANLGELDFFLFGSSAQRHEPPYQAAGLRYFSNELEARRDLIHYHPTVADAQRWAGVLQPKVMIPYAQFLFQGASCADLSWDELDQPEVMNRQFKIGDKKQNSYHLWLAELRTLAKSSHRSLLLLQPLQGIRF